MLRTYFVSFFLIVLLPASLFAQIEIKGQVRQIEKNLKFLEIQLINKDSIVVQSTLTDYEGKFSIKTERGNCQLLIKQVGTILYQKRFDFQGNQDLGIIEIDNSQELKEVMVNSKKKLIERKVDRLVFNVENSISASTGGDAINALKATPGINIQNDKISMIGKSSLAVMIDERFVQLSGDDLTNYLRTIKSEDIKSIEVITNPPSKYDAEGNSGIINIKLKKTKSNSWNASFRSAYIQSTYSSGSVGGSFAYQKNKIALTSNLNYSNGSNRLLENQKIDYATENWNSNDKLRSYNKIFGGKFSTDYKINENISIGFQYTGGNSDPTVKQNNLAVLSDVETNSPNQNIQTKLFEKKDNKYSTLNFYSKYKINPDGRNLSLDIDYFDYDKKSYLAFITDDYDVINDSGTIVSKQNLGNQELKNFSVKVDMVHPSKWANIDYGAKISVVQNNSELEYYNLNPDKNTAETSISNLFRYKENNQAVYFSGAKKIGSNKWEIQIGLRYEITQTNGYSATLNKKTDQKYSKLFPTSYITFTPNDNHSFSVNYGKRINRPRYSMLNPFREYNNAYSYIEGNPFLQPSISHNLSLGYILKNNFNSSLYYSLEKNGFSSITFIENGNINQITTNLNYFDSQNIGINESYVFNKFKFWESFNSLFLYYSKTKSDNISVESPTEGLGSSLSSNNSFIINKSKTILMNLDIMYSFPSTSINTRNEGVFNTDFGFKYLLLKKQLVVNFLVSDVFKSNMQRWSQKINGINSYNTNYEDARRFTISVSYKFGNNKLKIKENKAGNSEEKNRAGGN
ncbi:outer membrane beta-barrel family protein [Flavobacterium sp. 245]|uniref:outer membrane beta-barrel family protein n=1 Tax=Flavobacterium sp. 245 TaxID=2512115 RepID=UPI00106115C5|nr:outer membrane beta-barrel family protein [Flavobacterium sp. 245]TDP02468.1 outer membrane receptor protein involved in Fe transport [Flavobacterium sp. 245]